jgi:hypothetical protein
MQGNQKRGRLYSRTLRPAPWATPRSPSRENLLLRNNDSKSCNLYRMFTLSSLSACKAAFLVDLHKHLYHTQKFTSGIAETDIALGFVGA